MAWKHILDLPPFLSFFFVTSVVSETHPPAAEAEWDLTPFLSVSRATVSLKARLAAKLPSLLYIAEHSNRFSLSWVTERGRFT